MSESIDVLYERALGAGMEPYAYQRRIAIDGLPELLDVPTGCGKTPAMLLGWLYRRRFHPDPNVREATPRRLLWCLPLRSLVDQTARVAGELFRRLDLKGMVAVYRLLGGEPTRDSEWRRALDRDCVMVGTLDMLLSRALNRGYLASRFSWPIDFAIVNNDCHWVFDEVQLMDVALQTTRQLHGLRDALGVAMSTSSTWMSATIDRGALLTVDAPSIATMLTLDAEEVSPALAMRLDAPKVLVRREVPDINKYAKGFAEIVTDEHRPGTRTIAVLNSVDTACDTYRTLRKTFDDVVLMHSRFRPRDRAEALERVLDSPGGAEIVVSTQVIEAGVDVSSATLVTECAPWSSITQRAGRCNRWGELHDGGRVVVVNPSKVHPYKDHGQASQVDKAWTRCGDLHATTVTPKSLAANIVDEPRPPSAVLRRSDLLELFDTAPDLSGNDVDVSRFIRLDGDIDVAIAWRDFDARSGPPEGSPLPTRNERCRTSVAAARRWLDRHQYRDVWIPDPLNRSPRGGWIRAQRQDVRPGTILLAPSSLGGYSPDFGFDPSISTPVPEVHVADGSNNDLVSPLVDADLSMDDDPLSTDRVESVTLAQHLVDVEDAAHELCAQLRFVDGPEQRAVVRAGRLHDLGKAHDVWQSAIRKVAVAADGGAPLAKSAKPGRLQYAVPSFRHELASALALVAEPSLAHGGADVDPDLVTYLVGAHHGRVRITIPASGNTSGTVLGVRNDDYLGPVDLGNGETSPACTLSLDVTRLGTTTSGERSWTARALALLDQHGPFRLAWYEALVRIADWRASDILAPKDAR